MCLTGCVLVPYPLLFFGAILPMFRMDRKLWLVTAATIILLLGSMGRDAHEGRLNCPPATVAQGLASTGQVATGSDIKIVHLTNARFSRWPMHLGDFCCTLSVQKSAVSAYRRFLKSAQGGGHAREP